MTTNLKNTRLVRAAAWRLRVLDKKLFGHGARTGDERARGGRSGAGDDLALSRAEWRDQGATPGLVARARSLSQNSVAWTVMPSRLWLVHAGALLEAGDRETAERVVRTLLARKADGADLLATCLPVARFARELGVPSRAVARAAEVADVLDANLDRDLFGQVVAGRTVAVVGNGPGPLGAGRGEEIDAHDVVVRFNNHPAGYEADYGSRTDVWVRGAHRDVRDRAEIEDLSLVLWEMDLFRNVLEVPSHGDALYRDAQLFPEKLAHVDTATKLALRRESGLLLPTSGAQLLWMLHRAHGSLRDVDVYGFSTLDGNEETGHYFDALGDMGARHDVAAEGAFLRTLRPGGAVEDAPAASGPADGQAAGEVIVVGCAYRRYDPATGKTGGPAGVLATQRLALGDRYRGQRLEYLFDDGEKDALRERVAPMVAGLSGKVADIVLGGEHVASDARLLAARAEGRTLLLVCHDLGAAYGAYLLGVPYVLVYHQQGSTLQEMRSLGRTPTAHEEHVAGRLERLVLENARSVYFPSLGARDAYRTTSRIDEAADVRFADEALYNTVSAADHAPDAADRTALREEVARELRLPGDDTEVFVSVGDFNHDKGLDRVPALLDRYVALTGRKVVWVAVGAAGDGRRLETLRARQKGRRYETRLVGTRMTHDRLLALLDLADCYVMLHRTAIFDLATLEAMRAGKPLVLSPVGGNVEVDLDGNVLFVTDDTLDDACRVLETRDRADWGGRNRRVFEEHFSLDRFAARYRAMLDEHLDELVPPVRALEATDREAAAVAGSAA
ncbi:glycosyltransferase family 29 protein [Cellulosimicrobium marinum]|uniref:glycosyltransferase family 29 protein n=1 Tax=Cellulosimicrobium marinum TaxID=1638992 RepID=UPI001E595B19|nr:glycosyltransferase family 29 protein [Cellulosimicrobium marinum]MCB7137653.1 glycosyltransferase family 29 protein [Cellulosimicrobium marinum]